MRQSAQKRGQKFCTSKRAENEKTRPEKPEKGKTGCVLGAGGDESGCGQVQTDTKTRCLNQREHHNYTTHEKRKPAETQCFRRFLAGAEGLEPSARGFGVDVETADRERGRGSVGWFLLQIEERVVLVWCCEEFFRPKYGVKSPLLEDLPLRGRTHIAHRGLNQCRRQGCEYYSDRRLQYL